MRMYVIELPNGTLIGVFPSVNSALDYLERHHPALNDRAIRDVVEPNKG